MSSDSGLDSDLEPAERLRQIADTLGLPSSAREFALAVYSQAIENELFRGRTKEDVLAASLYIGGKHEGEPVQAEEIADVTDSDKSSLLDTRRHIDNRLELGLPPVNPKAYIGRYCDELEAGDELRSTAFDIVDACEEHNLVAGSPSGFAAGAIYAASVVQDAKFTQSEISDVSCVSEVTIRNWYSDQLEAYEPRQFERRESTSADA